MTTHAVSEQEPGARARRMALTLAVRPAPFAAGASQWLLGVSAVHPLVGSIAADAPWVALALGLLGSVLVAFVVDQAARRRDAALVLYRSEHRVAETLQRSLLPSLPAIAGLDVASRYVAGQADQQVGGDWFDVFEIAEGRVGIVIGDVIGHDIAAPAAMSQVRSALRAYAWQGAAPATVLDQLDHLVTAFETAALVTVFYGVLEHPPRMAAASCGSPTPATSPQWCRHARTSLDHHERPPQRWCRRRSVRARRRQRAGRVAARRHRDPRHPDTPPPADSAGYDRRRVPACSARPPAGLPDHAA